jgi:hypothetical protein
VPHIIEFRWAKAGETDDVPVVEHEPITTVTEVTAPSPRYVVTFQGMRIRPQLTLSDRPVAPGPTVWMAKDQMRSHSCEYLALANGCYRTAYAMLSLSSDAADVESRVAHKKIRLETKKNNDGGTQHARPA